MYQFIKKIADLLSGLQLVEVSTYHLSNKDCQTKKMNINLECIELVNALTEDFNLMRAWLIPSLMQVLVNNKHNEYPQKIYEVGIVFRKDDFEISEPKHLAVLSSHPLTDYTEIKQILDALLLALDLKYDIIETEHNSFIPGRVGSIIIKGKNIGFLGEIHPKVLSNFFLDNPVVALEIDVNMLFELVNH